MIKEKTFLNRVKYRENFQMKNNQTKFILLFFWGEIKITILCHHILSQEDLGFYALDDDIISLSD